MARQMTQKNGIDKIKLVDVLVKSAANRGVFLKKAVADFKKAYLMRALELYAGNPSRAAEVLGFTRHTFSRKMKTLRKGS